MITLVLGGEKSGKSDFALGLIESAPKPHWFVATGRALDPSFAAQISLHRAGRPGDVHVAEAVVDLPETLARLRPKAGAILADSLEFWLFSCIQADPAACDRHAAALERALSGWDGPELVLVSAEAGLGPMAADSLTRAFARRLGALNQMAARLADRAVLVVAGLPLALKGDLP